MPLHRSYIYISQRYHRGCAVSGSIRYYHWFELVAELNAVIERKAMNHHETVFLEQTPQEAITWYGTLEEAEGHCFEDEGDEDSEQEQEEGYDLYEEDNDEPDSDGYGTVEEAERHYFEDEEDEDSEQEQEEGYDLYEEDNDEPDGYGTVEEAERHCFEDEEKDEDFEQEQEKEYEEDNGEPDDSEEQKGDSPLSQAIPLSLCSC